MMPSASRHGPAVLEIVQQMERTAEAAVASLSVTLKAAFALLKGMPEQQLNELLHQDMQQLNIPSSDDHGASLSATARLQTLERIMQSHQLVIQQLLQLNSTSSMPTPVTSIPSAQNPTASTPEAPQTVPKSSPFMSQSASTTPPVLGAINTNDVSTHDMDLLDFGKHKGKTYLWAMVNDASYTTWCMARHETAAGGLGRFIAYLTHRLPMLDAQRRNAAER